MVSSLGLYFITVIVCTGFPLLMQYIPPQSEYWRGVYWRSFCGLIILGAVLTYWDVLEKEDEKGRGQVILGKNIVHTYQEDMRADAMELRYQKQLEASDHDNKERMANQAKKKAWQEKFLNPLGVLIKRANGELTIVNTSPEAGFDVLKLRAIQWRDDVMTFLSKRCTQSVVMQFTDQPREGSHGQFSQMANGIYQREYSTVLPPFMPIVTFYKLRMEYLEKLKREPTGCKL